MTDQHVTLTDFLADNPSIVLEGVARDYGVSLGDVLDALPPGNCTQVAGQHFSTVMAAISLWGDVTLLVHSADAIIEFHGPVPVGRSARGFFNLRNNGRLSGHIRADHCAHIVFVERPFMGMPTASVVFLNPEGAAMYKVFVRCIREDRSLDAAQLAQFRELAASLYNEAETYA
ncbi:heme utilization cystosolic carrier protein HutX [Neisseriaceae bacterium JH1-16]|nr:heme utilization cystosolic carrier protein HutX [Neisseriaceae bacterium JH1-16]